MSYITVLCVQGIPILSPSPFMPSLYSTLLGGECSAFLASGSDPTDDSRMKHIDFSSPGL